jgi:hypothetical protein
LARRGAEVGYALRERLTVYPRYALSPEWIAEPLRDRVRRWADAEGYAIPAEKHA